MTLASPKWLRPAVTERPPRSALVLLWEEPMNINSINDVSFDDAVTSAMSEAFHDNALQVASKLWVALCRA